jgi:hypothetical protein
MLAAALRYRYRGPVSLTHHTPSAGFRTARTPVSPPNPAPRSQAAVTLSDLGPVRESQAVRHVGSGRSPPTFEIGSDQARQGHILQFER